MKLQTAMKITVIGFIALTLIAFLSIAFIKAEINPFLWSETVNYI